ncbi:MAG: YbaB/EbfC family nucleoid-associated protein [Myxococcales bacterium]|nr:YbaB/EbfC family nucleoid-associated protein [Myxococcales bacterium]MCB9750278.1 YbaB/EbfC family nucleoid-associated protein [Myxococcales bacterium]
MSEFDLGSMMRQAQQMREQMQYIQKGLENETVEGTAGAGVVKAIVTGGQRVKSVTIDPEALAEDPEMVQDLIVAAVNNGLDKARALAQERLGSVLPPGLMGGIPGL